MKKEVNNLIVWASLTLFNGCACNVVESKSCVNIIDAVQKVEKVEIIS